MRCDQFVGLHPRAQSFLDENGKTDRVVTLVYRNGKLESNTKTSPIVIVEGLFQYYGMSDHYLGTGGHALPGYLLKDGRKIYEKVQAEPWSSGPMFFTHLVDENGVSIEGTSWENDEIENLV